MAKRTPPSNCSEKTERGSVRRPMGIFIPEGEGQGTRRIMRRTTPLTREVKAHDTKEEEKEDKADGEHVANRKWNLDPSSLDR